MYTNIISGYFRCFQYNLIHHFYVILPVSIIATTCSAVQFNVTVDTIAQMHCESRSGVGADCNAPCVDRTSMWRARKKWRVLFPLGITFLAGHMFVMFHQLQSINESELCELIFFHYKVIDCSFNYGLKFRKYEQCALQP